jgi:hypothetical protein
MAVLTTDSAHTIVVARASTGVVALLALWAQGIRVGAIGGRETLNAEGAPEVTDPLVVLLRAGVRASGAGLALGIA